MPRGLINQVQRIDVLEGLAGLMESSIDTVITDPPYELGFMGKGGKA